MTLSELLDELHALRTRGVTGETAIAVFGDNGDGPEMEIKTVDVEGGSRRFIAINCEEA